MIPNHLMISLAEEITHTLENTNDPELKEYLPMDWIQFMAGGCSLDNDGDYFPSPELLKILNNLGWLKLADHIIHVDDNGAE